MSDTPKFEVIDRRKFKADEEHESQKAALEEAQARPETKAAPEPAPSAGPHLVVSEGRNVEESAPAEAPEPALSGEAGNEMPPPPTAEESHEQKAAYDASAQRLEEIIRAQNPAVGAQPPITFEHLVQQFYVSAMIQMGAGAQEGQRPRVLAEKTKGNLTPGEDRALQTVLFEVRMAFMELTSMINLQAMQPPQPPPPGKR